MKILWVKVGGLWPANTGGRVRSVRTIEQLAQRDELEVLTTHSPRECSEPVRGYYMNGVRVTSIALTIPKKNTPKFASALIRSWPTIYPVDLWRCRSRQLREMVREKCVSENFDVCVGDFLAAMPNVDPQLPVPVALFQHNVEHEIWRRLADGERGWLRRRLLEFEVGKLRRYERRMCQRVNLVIAVSERDAEKFRRLTGRQNVVAIPTGVDVDYFKPNENDEDPESLVFSGSMDWYPNEQAVTYFCREILPLLRQCRPNVKLTVVGRNPSLAMKRLAGEAGVILTGTVDDVRPYVHAAQCFIVPLKSGGGTKLKMFEGLAMGKAVVSTGIGAEGLPIVHGEHYLNADTAEGFAESVLQILTDANLRRRLGRSGRELVEKNFGWHEVGKRFERHIREVKHAS